MTEALSVVSLDGGPRGSEVLHNVVSVQVDAPDLLPWETRDFAAVAAASTHPVLLEGESGVGKSHLARLIHQLSSRRNRSFVSINCGAIPRELFEREMFGHVRGAFTGATESRPGLFEAAKWSTLFLDEISELPIEMQPKLLHALEDGTVRRLGSIEAISVDVRIITASNQDLRTLVEGGRFREDLFYRCCVLEIRVPPLRERRSAIPNIVGQLLRATADADTPACAVSSEAIERISAYHWPGNIRELSNALCQAGIAARGGTIELSHLPERIRLCGASNGSQLGGARKRRRYVAPEDVEDERALILDTLREQEGNRTRAANSLGMSRSTLWAKLRLHGIAERSQESRSWH